MSRARTVTILIAAAIGLTGCGSSTSSTYDTANALAAKVGCTGFKGGSTQMFVKDGGECTLDGQKIYLYVFGDNDSRDKWVTAAKAMGAPGTVGQGERWIIHSLDASAAKKSTDAAGGALT